MGKFYAVTKDKFIIDANGEATIESFDNNFYQTFETFSEVENFINNLVRQGWHYTSNDGITYIIEKSDEEYFYTIEKLED